MEPFSQDLRVSDNHIYITEFDALLINLETSAIDKYPAKQHAISVTKHLGVKEGLIYLRGQQSALLEDSDMPVPFRQRRFFYYLSGVDFEDCIVTYDIERDSLRLYIPPVNPREIIWHGPTPSIKECEEKYDVDYVGVTSDVNHDIMRWIIDSPKPTSTIYILHQEQSPELMHMGSALQSVFEKKKLIMDWTHLQPAMEAARVIKSDYEVGLIRRANNISSVAHRAVLANLAGMSNESEIQATFEASCVSAGAKKQAYDVIAGSGENASTLHYVANNQPLKGRQLVCLDAGCEWECYASDVTRTFPISGAFSKEAKEIYDIVQEMQDKCIERVKPGVIFRDLHVLAMEIAVKGLMKLGIMHNGTFKEVLPTGVAFFPHGLGHHLGLETHDVSYTQRLLADTATMHDMQRKKSPFPDQLTSIPYDKLVRLAPNMVITVEPGIYFSQYALQQVYLKSPQHAKYINASLLEKYYPIGGVRIEDDILVTSDGCEVLTTAPKGEESCRIIRRENDPTTATIGQRARRIMRVAEHTETELEAQKMVNNIFSSDFREESTSEFENINTNDRRKLGIELEHDLQVERNQQRKLNGGFKDRSNIMISELPNRDGSHTLKDFSSRKVNNRYMICGRRL